ncbi:E2 ubiquitin-conjugating enzyme [Plasmodiophora brassicae]|uniref:UBC core domain-containing protein n=1 Tax=Plasmodiophora brassicae TaxID=37360 RepID=A0A0G4IZR2_PLABS|nr:hypothetical protein PBRA_008160 [Plasmodiophora brassicae]SPR01977.1 unnamed protein product [Plasmodiophora brassicae]
MSSPPSRVGQSGAVKRILQEIREMRQAGSGDFVAAPLDDNMFDWHFTIRGPRDTEFEGGIYHGRIVLPSDYPFKPPDLMLLTPSGRFETGKKICLSISGFHPEFWQPSWSIRTVLVALIAFLPTDPQGAIGSLEYSKEERRAFAAQSTSWKCPVCGVVNADHFSTQQAPNLEQRPIPDTERQVADQHEPAAEQQRASVAEHVAPAEQTPRQEESPRTQAPTTAHQASSASGSDVLWSAITLTLFISILAILIKKIVV